jgi:molecular chaperone DnaK
MVFQVENALNEVGDKISSDEKAAVQADVDALKAVVERVKNVPNLSDSEVSELKSGKEKLMNSAQKVFAKMYEQAAPQGQAGPGPQSFGGGSYGGNNGGDDDVVDADYTEV